MQDEKRGPGRPKKEEGRNAKLYIKVSPTTKDIWEREAERRGISLGDLATELSLTFAAQKEAAPD